MSDSRDVHVADLDEPVHTVKECADLVGVSVRTLHHWDQVGVVSPSYRSTTGYRLYTDEDVASVQRALVYREVGMPLAEIAEVLSSSVSARAHLEHQRSAVRERIDVLSRVSEAIDELLKKEMEMTLTPQETSHVLGRTWTDPYEDEAYERWGDTDDWAESQRRRADAAPGQLTADVEHLKVVETALGEAKRSGVKPGSQRANDLAEAHRKALTWFDTTPAKHVLLARMYISDPRFTKHYEEIEPGLAAWFKDVVDANARAHGVDPDTATWA